MSEVSDLIREITGWIGPFVLDISRQWVFVLTVFGVLVVLNQFKLSRRYTSALLFPVFLLLVRNIALFVPVSGAVSNEDHVIFWSTSAYWYFILLSILLLVLLILIFLLTDSPNQSVNEEIILPWILVLTGLPWVGSMLLLPVDGICHLYMPLVSLLGLSKLLLVSPALLPVAWITLLMQLTLLWFAAHEVGREINKLALISLLIAGFLHFALQAVIPTAPRIAAIQSTWRTTNPSSSDVGSETAEFLTEWARKLPEIETLGVNLVEKVLPYRQRDESQQALFNQLPVLLRFLWQHDHHMLPLFAGTGLILFLIMVERLRFGDEQEMYEPEHDAPPV